ncbi:hypothetical protein N7517_009671 [Penicillium concentricum]|uniref:Hydrophobin n=1 Tax=Penicillium concentricum TaxID=293559 RepID=A0A9W9RJ35_9EURO|nr:uncharacterized protein N7517_009671 [Penicillium concentricum]KAJ5360480.1 hypothetical protein N7517_009671 [Penicillium concentricum]
MKFSIATIAVLATAVTAQQGYQQPQQYQGQPQQYQGGQGYQQPQQYQGGQGYQQPQQYQQYIPQQNKYSPAEAQAFHTCIDQMLDQFNIENSGSSVSCSTFKCLDQTANQYSRGGVLAGLGNVVSLACGFGGIIPKFL